jgi:hypothetical protein
MTLIIDMFSGTGELGRAVAAGLARTARIRLAGNAVVRLQGRLMLQRGLLAVGNINLKGIL